MTDTSPEHAPAPAHPDADAVGVDFQAITQGYQQELAEQVQRRIMAEAAVAALKAERANLWAQLAEQAETIHALSPGAPTVQEN